MRKPASNRAIFFMFGTSVMAVGRGDFGYNERFF